MMILNLLINSAWAEEVATAATKVAPPQPSIFAMILPFGLMFVVFYFLLIRPQQKKMKEHEGMVNTLQKGEEVITQSGIFGVITGIADKVVTLEIAENVKIKVLKSQVATVLKGDQKIPG